MQVHTPATSDLKCPTCILIFSTVQQHKQHYKSDFHRYNLKRKMVKLAPATEQQFKAKKIQAKAQQQQQFKCGQCNKKFNSVKTFNQHIETKKHDPKINKTNQNKDNKQKTVTAFKKNRKMCIFCKQQFSTFSQNIRHMQSSHSFFIPQLKYCTDQQGLIQYLQQKVQVGFMCILCENKNAKDFASGQAVRKHMTDKGHCFMKTDQGFDEYLDYYDFSSQFKEILESQKDKYIPGIQYTTLKVVVKDDKSMSDEEDWEDEASQSGSQTENKNTKVDNKIQEDEWQQQSDGQQIKEKKPKQKIQKSKKKVKTYHIMRPTATSNGELLLPNGKILGHRKFRYLYNQTYRPTFWLNKDLKALGYQFVNNALITRERLIDLQRHDKLLYRYKNRWDKKQLRDGMQNNLLQKFFRTSNSL